MSTTKFRSLSIIVLLLLMGLALFFLDRRTSFFDGAVDDTPAVNVIPRPENWAVSIDKRFNLYEIEPNLYRSALPDSEALPRLEALGIATVINFYQQSDASWLSAPQVRQIHLPLRADRITDTEALEALRAIRQAQGEGAVLIHCKHGQNRTGLIAALYRVVYQGWSKEQARAEMLGGGFGGEERLDDALRYLRRVDIDKIKAALASGACSTSPWAWCTLKGWFSHDNKADVPHKSAPQS
ncbi:MAG: dual specificity protein phosphatase family protein [Zoogloeaceae bacterium]|jgi:protein tyrosine/serine phosphatase|nr:dual specificity protein phosphatase family protein [Zoogloeaceae bacterium]